ncbi:MAG: hypothetical protein ACR2OR_05315 [Hyphomicrobiales bacterium]
MSVQLQPSRFAINSESYMVTIAGVIAAPYSGQTVFRPLALAIFVSGDVLSIEE